MEEPELNKFCTAVAADVAPVPPLAIGNVPVTPGVIFADPLNDAVLVLARFVRTVRAVASFVALAALPPYALDVSPSTELILLWI